MYQYEFIHFSDCSNVALWLFPWSIRLWCVWIRPHFYQTRSAWSVDQGSNKNHSPAYNFAPTVTKFCVMWEGLSLPRDTKFGNCRCKIVDSRSFPSWSLIHGLRWSGLIKVGPGANSTLLVHVINGGDEINGVQMCDWNCLNFNEIFICIQIWVICLDQGLAFDVPLRKSIYFNDLHVKPLSLVVSVFTKPSSFRGLA